MLPMIIAMFTNPTPPKPPANIQVHAGDLMRATTILTSPPSTPETISDEEFQRVRQAIHTIAIDWQILDRREAHYIITKSGYWQIDINILRNRYQALKDAPPIEDANRLPPIPEMDALIKFNKAYQKHLKLRMALELDRRPAIQQAMSETELLCQTWDMAKTARNEFYYITVRRQALKDLRCRLTSMERDGYLKPNAYERAEMPDNVPIWRFNEIK